MLVTGEAVRDGEGGPESDRKREIRGVLHRLAEVDSVPSGLPLRHPPCARPHVRGVRPGNQGLERHCAGTHGQGKCSLRPTVRLIHY